MNLMLSTTRLYLDDFAKSIEGRTADDDERADLKCILDNQLNMALGIATGAKLERPIWPPGESTI